MVKKGPDRIDLGRGVALNFLENDRYKTNYINLYFITPLTEETASLNTLLSRVLTRGCEKYPSQRLLSRELDAAYDAELDIDTGKVGEWHCLNLSLCLLADEYSPEGGGITEAGLSLMEEVMFHPLLEKGAFRADYVESERRLALYELAGQINHKARYARSRMIRHMCRLEPYGISSLGESRCLRAITPERLADYYRQLIATARVEMFFVGRFDRKAVEKTLRGIFDALKREPVSLPLISVRTSARRTREVTEKMDVTQAHLVMGFRTGTAVPDKATLSLSLYNSVLGGSLTSKLFTVLREKMSLCYSISSGADNLKGILMIYAGIAPENRGVAIKEALSQMEAIRRGDVTEEELESARGAMINALQGLEDNPPALAEWYLPRILTKQEDTPAELVRRLKRVTREDVIAVSQNLTLDTIYTLTAKEGL